MRGLTGSYQHAAKFNVKCLIIVNESPWQTALPVCALRFARAAASVGLEITAVFFREDGIYNALDAAATDAGTPDLNQGWRDLAAQGGVRLLLCSASCQRRLPAGFDLPDSQQPDFRKVGFQQSGLADMLELLQQADRVVSF